jgi:uncharacterized repeat protein (TIGR01451 family)
MNGIIFWRIVRSVLLGVMAVWSGAATAQIRYTNSVDAPISETVTPCSAPLLRSFDVTTPFTVSDVDIGVLLAHTYRGDLLFTLQSPDGTRVQIFSGTGTTADNVNVLMDDGAALPVTGHSANDTAAVATIVPPFQRNFKPASPLSAFNGLNALGTWTLEICDRFNLDSGNFFQADLFLTPTPTTMSLSKQSAIISDPSGGPNPKAIPGATIRYCILITNTGPGLAASLVGTDSLPIGMNYIAGSIRSGGTCASTTIVEDDNATGADETDPFGASFTSGSVGITTPSLSPNSSFAISFQALIN